MWAPWVAPMFVYVGLTQAESLIPEQHHPTWYPIAYALKVLITVGIMLTVARPAWADLKRLPNAGGWLLAVVSGLAITGLWVGLDGTYPALPLLGGNDARESYDPNVLAPVAMWAFLSVRMLGLAVVVPIFEELFWRSFLMRLVQDLDDFRRVPIGVVTPLAVVVTSVGFMLAHPEWLVALITGLIWAGLLAATRSVTACVVSHAVANLGLGIYVLVTGEYHFW
jgi:uncharacterized protein